MKKIKIHKFVKNSQIPIEYYPVDIYFIQKKIKKDNQINDNKKTTNVKFEPNILMKYDYNGEYFGSNIGAMSQIINLEKIIKIEKNC